MAECGTPQRYNEGCRGAGCTNHGTDLMTCTESSIRYAGDYAYRKQVDAGTATAEKESFGKPRRAIVKPAPKPGRVPRVKVAPIPKVPVVHAHGATQALRKACKVDCPNVLTGGHSCTERELAARKLWMANRVKGNGKPIEHGTRNGAQYGCKRDTCPGGPNGDTCTDAANRYNRERAQHKRQLARNNNTASVNSAGAVSDSTEGTT